MQINEQELAEAVDRLREGETVMGVSYEEVLNSIYLDVKFSMKILRLLGDDYPDGAKSFFELYFNKKAKSKLTEALRTHKEQQAGLV